MSKHASSSMCRFGLLLLVLAMANPGLARELLVAGMDSDGGMLQVFDAAGGSTLLSPYGAAFQGGVRVASGDINGDGVPDIITGSGPGMVAAVRVFDGATLVPFRELEAFGPQFSGGVYVATGDVNGDGFADIIVGSGPTGGPRVRVFDGVSNQELMSFVAYDPEFTGGVFVAAGDVDGDGVAEVITGAGPGGGSHVKVFNGSTGVELNQFFAFGPNFDGGVHVAVGDWDGDGRADVIVGAGDGDQPEVRVFDGLSGSLTFGFFAYEQTFRGGVRVATGDVNSDGMDDIVTAPGAGGAPLLTRFTAPTAVNNDSVLVFTPSYTGGLFLANAVVIPILLRDGFE